VTRAAAAALVAGTAAAPVLPGRRGVERLDRRLLSALVARRSPALKRPAVGLTALAEPAVVLPTCALAAAVGLARGVPAGVVARQVGWAAAGIGARRLLAEAVRRGRPPESWWWHAPAGHSYPSRHVTWAVLGFGVAADVTGVGRRLRPSAIVLTAVVASTRLVLAVHWPSDVLAALVFSFAWRRLSTPNRSARSPARS
jgi:membrane-associated phospholipid phosphatase